MALTRRLVKGQSLTAAEHDANIDHFEENPNGVYIPKASGTGIKIDETAPDWGWHDLKSDLVLTGDASDPVWATYQGNIKQMQFAVGKVISTNFHLPHDYALGTDIFIHIHWSHNSATVVSGDITGNFEVCYAKGYDQAFFSTPIVVNMNNVPASTVRYQHMVSEGQLSAALGAGGLLDTADLEPDGLLLCRLEMTANTINDGTDPFIHAIDIHYQSTGVGTKQKAPDFYT